MCPHCIHCHDQAILRRETQHCSHCYVQEPPRRETHHCVYCHEKATFRREAHHCKHCCEAMSREFYRVHQRESPEAYQQSNTRQFDAIVPLSSGNDAAVHREVLSQSDEDDNSDMYALFSIFYYSKTLLSRASELSRVFLKSRHCLVICCV